MSPDMALAIIEFVQAGGEFYLLTGNDFTSAKENFLAVLFEITKDDLSLFSHSRLFQHQ